MTIWKYAGAVAGGAGGFLVGGPAGAVAGAGAGYSLGKAQDDANAAANDPNTSSPTPVGYTDQNGYGYGNFTPDANNTMGFYSSLAQQQGGAAAPQLQRTSVDYSGGASQPTYGGQGGQGQGGSPAYGGGPRPGGYYAPGQRPVEATQGYANAADSARSVSSAMGGVFPGGSPRPAPQQPPAPNGGAPATINPGGAAHGWQPGSGKFGDTHVAPGPGAPPGQQGPAGPTPQGPTGPTGEFANKNYQNQMDTRNNQNAFISRLQSDMNGGAPSAAQAQLHSGIDQSIAAQNAMAASAGPGNYGAATRASMTNAAQANQQGANQSAILRANEYAGARDALGNTLTNQRAADLQATGMSYDNAVKQAQIEADQNKTQANLQMQQNVLNQHGQMGYYGMANQIGSEDEASRMHFYDLMAQKYANDKGLAQNQSQFNTQETDKWIGTGAAMAGQAIQYGSA